MAIASVDVVTSAQESGIIKNGSIIVYCNTIGNYQTIDTYVSNIPTYSGIINKYDTKFNEVGYYVTPDVIDGGT